MKKARHWHWVKEKEKTAPMFIYKKGSRFLNIYYNDVTENMCVKWYIYLEAIFKGFTFEDLKKFNLYIR